MKIIAIISDLTIPLIFLGIIVYGMLKKVPIFDEFVKGAKTGLETVVNILPTFIGLMVSIGMLRASGALDLFGELVTPIARLIRFPEQLVPIVLMRSISSSAATGLVLDIFKTFGPDSLIGRMTSVIMGCTETIFYTMSIYFISVKIRKTRYTLSGALLANLAGIIVSVILTYAIFD
ncbi:MAG: nucleoside recognition protein [Clostridiales bacterium]|nr:nucleoside recognition protein [Clostridiales bacterium]